MAVETELCNYMSSVSLRDLEGRKSLLQLFLGNISQPVVWTEGQTGSFWVAYFLWCSACLHTSSCSEITFRWGLKHSIKKTRWPTRNSYFTLAWTQCMPFLAFERLMNWLACAAGHPLAWPLECHRFRVLYKPLLSLSESWKFLGNLILNFKISQLEMKKNTPASENPTSVFLLLEK